MKLTSLTGKWKGSFCLGAEYDEAAGNEVEFILDLKDENGSFEGICQDMSTKDLFQEPIIVSGTWDVDGISFAKQYPFMHYKDGKGPMIVDRSKPHPIINYTGQYNDEESEFYGVWSMIVGSGNAGSGYLHEELTGTWWMKALTE